MVTTISNTLLLFFFCFVFQQLHNNSRVGSSVVLLSAHLSSSASSLVQSSLNVTVPFGVNRGVVGPSRGGNSTTADGGGVWSPGQRAMLLRRSLASVQSAERAMRRAKDALGTAMDDLGLTRPPVSEGRKRFV